VATAVLELLRSGDTELNTATVAEVAGVSRSTVYRRWPSRDELLREAFSEHIRRLVVPDTGSFATDIRQLARRLARFFSDPTEIAMSVAMAVHADPGFSDWQIEYWNDQALELGRPFTAAIERGELPENTDIAVLVEMLLSPMVVRTAIMKERLLPRYVQQLAAQVIRLAGSDAE
jgi:AcrR family transcriptional regulator